MGLAEIFGEDSGADYGGYGADGVSGSGDDFGS